MVRKHENPSLFIWPVLGLLWVGLVSGCSISSLETPSAIAAYPASITPIQLSLSPTSTPFPHRVLVFPEKGATRTPTPTRTPTKTRLPTYTPTITPTPFPTPVSIQPNAIAFIAGSLQNYSGLDSLWVANVDGSGAKQILTHLPKKNYWTIQWSPNGNWLSYEANNELWLIRPNGENHQQLLNHAPEKGDLGGYAWSPDGSKIAFSLSTGESAQPGGYIGIIEIESREIQYLTEFAPHPSFHLIWSHDGNIIAFTGLFGPISFINVKTGEIIAGTTIPDICGGTFNAMNWSPDNSWLLHTHWGNGRYAQISACITNLSGESIRIAPGFTDFGRIEDAIWSKDSQSVYLSAFDASPDHPELDPDPRLLRFDVQQHTFERVLSLGLYPYTRVSLLSSPNKQFLSNITSDGTESFSLELISIPDFQKRIIPILAPIYSQTWSTDNLHYVFFVGQKITSMGGDPDFGIFYSMDINTGQILPLTGEHLVKAWVISPVASSDPLP